MKTLLILLLFSFSMLFAETEHAQSVFRFGERPKNSIFDPAEILTIQEQAELADSLAKVRWNEGIDVMVVILPEISDALPEDVAASFALNWATTKVNNAVVLHVPGKEGSPWIFPGEVMSSKPKPEVLQKSIAAGQKRAAAIPTDFGKVRAASTEASDIIRYWIEAALIGSEESDETRIAARLLYESFCRLLKLASVIGLLSLISFVVLCLIVMFIRRSRPKFFPTIRISQRLGAPYSGGNNAVSKPGSRPLR